MLRDGRALENRRDQAVLGRKGVGKGWAWVMDRENRDMTMKNKKKNKNSLCSVG